MQAGWRIVALTAAVLIAATGARAQEALKIGGIGPLSGGGTAWGLAAQRGMELAVEDVNAKGGVKAGGKTYKLELIMYDDQYTGQGGIQAREGLAVLLAEQNATWALSLASRAVILDRGKVKMTGEAAALFDDAEVRRAYLGV